MTKGSKAMASRRKWTSSRLTVFVCAGFLTSLAISLGGARSATAAPCPNQAIRAAQTSETLPDGSVDLPECMGLEMVTPPKKYNQTTTQPEFSADGNRVLFASVGALAESPRQTFVVDRYIASRGGSGWMTQPTAIPPNFYEGSAGKGYPCAYSTDLSHWTLIASTAPQASAGITTAFRGGLGGLFSPLSPTVAPLSGHSFANPVVSIIFESLCEGASADSSRFFFSVNRLAEGPQGISYLPGDPVPLSRAGFANVYEAYLNSEGAPTLTLLQRDKDGMLYGGNCGAQIGFSGDHRGSVSPDASRIFFTTRPGQPAPEAADPELPECSAANPLRIMERLETPAGPVISQLVSNECTRVSPPCSSADGDDEFQGASQEGTKVYFTTTRQLANTDRDETKDLYLYDASRPLGERLTQVSAGDGTDPSPGEGAEVLRLAAFSGDGSHAYFVARGVLTTAANGFGDNPEAGEPNLYLYERDAEYPAGRTVFIATLASSDSPVWQPGPGNGEAIAVPLLGADPVDQAVGGDGHVLVFQSDAPLAPGDSDGGHRDVYRYDSTTGELTRVSAAPPGGSDNGALDATARFSGGGGEVGPQSLYWDRSTSEDGETIVFQSEEALAPGAAEGGESSYIWHEGALGVVPTALEPTVNTSGREVAFQTDRRLLPQDGDGARDIYVARSGGGFPVPEPLRPCEGEACQAPFVPAPAQLRNATEAARSSDNVKRVRCRKGRARRHGRCVKPRKSHRHKSHRRHKHRMHQHQGGNK